METNTNDRSVNSHDVPPGFFASFAAGDTERKNDCIKSEI